MSIVRTTIAMFALITLAAFAAVAEESKEAAKVETPLKLKNQTHCPVMGGVIDSTAYTDIQGQRVYHCCPGCSASLKADPDKYFKKAAAEGVLFENIQTTCTVSGDRLKNKSVYVDFEGRRLIFCETDCRDAFNKAPGNYLKAMDGKARRVDHKDADKVPAPGHSCGGHS